MTTARQFPIKRLRPDGPVLDGQLLEREVFRIPGREPCADGKRGSPDEAVALTERDPLLRFLSPPGPGVDPFSAPEGRHAEPTKQSVSSIRFGGVQATNELLDVDGRGQRDVADSLDLLETSPDSRSASEEVDQDSRIQKYGQRLADPSFIRMTLGGDPRGRIVVPIVVRLPHRAERRTNQLPALFGLERCTQRSLDEPTSAARAHSLVKAHHEVVIQMNVNSHSGILAH